MIEQILGYTTNTHIKHLLRWNYADTLGTLTAVIVCLQNVGREPDVYCSLSVVICERKIGSSSN